jgi:sulfite reductase (NADPH) flavoprotein alpha-component
MFTMDNITIIFGTVMGTAEGCATKISEVLAASNLESEVVDMEEYDHSRLAEKGLLIVVTSTTGNGVPPENARALHAHLSNDKPEIARSFAVMSLGDSFRTHFAQCGKDFDRMLEELGGTRIIDRIDSDGVVEAPLKQFQENLLDYFEKETELYHNFTRKEVPKEPEVTAQTHQSNEQQTATNTDQKKGILSRVKRRVVNKIRSFIG